MPKIMNISDEQAVDRCTIVAGDVICSAKAIDGGWSVDAATISYEPGIGYTLSYLGNVTVSGLAHDGDGLYLAVQASIPDDRMADAVIVSGKAALLSDGLSHAAASMGLFGLNSLPSLIDDAHEVAGILSGMRWASHGDPRVVVSVAAGSQAEAFSVGNSVLHGDGAGSRGRRPSDVSVCATQRIGGEKAWQVRVSCMLSDVPMVKRLLPAGSACEVLMLGDPAI